MSRKNMFGRMPSLMDIYLAHVHSEEHERLEVHSKGSIGETANRIEHVALHERGRLRMPQQATGFDQKEKN